MAGFLACLGSLERLPHSRSLKRRGAGFLACLGGQPGKAAPLTQPEKAWGRFSSLPGRAAWKGCPTYFSDKV